MKFDRLNELFWKFNPPGVALSLLISVLVILAGIYLKESVYSYCGMAITIFLLLLNLIGKKEDDKIRLYLVIDPMENSPKIKRFEAKVSRREFSRSEVHGLLGSVCKTGRYDVSFVKERLFFDFIYYVIAGKKDIMTIFLKDNEFAQFNQDMFIDYDPKNNNEINNDINEYRKWHK